MTFNKYYRALMAVLVLGSFANPSVGFSKELKERKQNESKKLVKKPANLHHSPSVYDRQVDKHYRNENSENKIYYYHTEEGGWYSTGDSAN